MAISTVPKLMQRSLSGHPGQQGGFTLIELLVVSVILAIVAGVAVPSFRNMSANSNLRTTTVDLTTAINVARAEAVNRRGNVALRALDGSDWSSGWVLDYSVGGIDEQNQEFLPATGVSIQSGDSDVTFRPNGTASREIEFRICGKNDNGRLVEVTRVGRVSNVEQRC